jgi:hypothetical protein
MHEQMDTTTPVYQLYFRAMEAQTQEEADALLKELIALAIQENHELTYDKALAIQLSNIGYFTGYLDTVQEQRRVLALYRTEHPIFGTYEREITPDKAFRAGVAMGAALREGEVSTEALQTGVKAARKIIEQP